MPVFVSAGNGQPNAAVDPNEPLDGLVIESFAQTIGRSFATAAAKSGAVVTTDFYGAGAHTWPFWDREIPVAWKTLAVGLGLPAQ